MFETLNIFIVILGYVIIIGGSTWIVSRIWPRGICMIDKLIKKLIG